MPMIFGHKLQVWRELVDVAGPGNSAPAQESLL
jgi:hypothetical protein